MVEKTINNHKIVFYDSIEDLPIVQFHRYSKYALLESGVGDNINDVDRHITRIVNLLSDSGKAYNELLNLRQCIYMILSEQELESKATLSLIKSVDGEDWTDYSDDGLEALYQKINGTSLGELRKIAKEVRGAIDENLLLYFPGVFEDSTQKNYSDLLRRRALLQLDSIVKGTDNKEVIERITKEIFSMQNPKIFIGAESEEIRFDKQFEEMCLLISKEFGGNVKKYTTMEFYTAVERLNKQYSETKKRKK